MKRMLTGIYHFHWRARWTSITDDGCDGDTEVQRGGLDIGFILIGGNCAGAK